METELAKSSLGFPDDLIELHNFEKMSERNIFFLAPKNNNKGGIYYIFLSAHRPEAGKFWGFRLKNTREIMFSESKSAF